jgi:hypothetical protein
MNARATLTVIFAIAAFGLIVDSAMGKEVPDDD